MLQTGNDKRGDFLVWRDKFINKIVCGDCAVLLKELPNHCIDLTVTSPPYGQIRDYKGYSFPFEAIAKELFRVTKKGGVLVWVVNDEVINGSESGESFKQVLNFKDIGFNLHDTMIYGKTGIRHPSPKRYHQVFEYMFILSKGAPKTFNGLKDRMNIKSGRYTSYGWRRQKDGSIEDRKVKEKVPPFGLRYNIWIYSYGHDFVPDFVFEHPATFPEPLAEDHIVSWSNKGDLVLDPFVGSGTTCKMARENERHFIGIDISKEYCKIARKRVKGIQTRLV